MKKCIDKESSATIYADGKIVRCYQEFLENKKHFKNNDPNIHAKMNERCMEYCGLENSCNALKTIYLIMTTTCPFECLYCPETSYRKFHQNTIKSSTS